jgi:hypothetical protein
MPVIFVHGVATRIDRPRGKYERLARRRDQLFQRLALKGLLADVNQPIISPYWGDWGAHLAWDLASIPASHIEAFGEEEEVSDSITDSLLAVGRPHWEEDGGPLTAIAKADGLPNAVDLLVAAGFTEELLEDGNLEPSDLSEEEHSADVAVALFRLAEREPHPHWLTDVQSDGDLLDRLIELVNAQAGTLALDAYGGWGWEAWGRFVEGMNRVGSFAPRIASRGLLATTRSTVQRKVTAFLGDIFVYLNSGMRGEKIREIVGSAIRAGAASRSHGNPLIIIAHSMGGNICYDLLSSRLADIEVDVFVTVGSQVGFFEELKLFSMSDELVHARAQVSKVTPPATIRNWLNVLDVADPLAFTVEAIFGPPAIDFSYNTGAGLLASHSAYWIRPSFHAKLGERLRGVLT